MTKVTHIPAEGEFFSGYVPAKRQLAHVSFGVSSADPDVVMNDTATYQLFAMDRPCIIFGAWVQTEEAWTTSVVATIGDTTTADWIIADTTMNMAATGAVLIASTNALPKIFATAQDINVAMSGAAAAAGLTHVYLDYAVLED